MKHSSGVYILIFCHLFKSINGNIYPSLKPDKVSEDLWFPLIKYRENSFNFVYDFTKKDIAGIKVFQKEIVKIFINNNE